MIPDLDVDDISTFEENTFESRVSTKMKCSLITILDDFKDNEEVLIIGNMIFNTHVVISHA